MYIYISPSHSWTCLVPPHPALLGHHRAPSWAPSAISNHHRLTLSNKCYNILTCSSLVRDREVEGKGEREREWEKAKERKSYFPNCRIRFFSLVLLGQLNSRAHLQTNNCSQGNAVFYGLKPRLLTSKEHVIVMMI